MTLLATLGVVLVFVGLGFIAVSMRLFYLSLGELYQNESFTNSVFKRY